MRIKRKSKFPTESKLRLGSPHRVKCRGKLNMQMWRKWRSGRKASAAARVFGYRKSHAHTL